jgi:hypothetical protein
MTDEQREIIRRYGVASARFDTAYSDHQAAVSRTSQSIEVAGQGLVHSLATIGGALERAMARLEQANARATELAMLNQQCGDIFREYLDTLTREQ